MTDDSHAPHGGPRPRTAGPARPGPLAVDAAAGSTPAGRSPRSAALTPTPSPKPTPYAAAMAGLAELLRSPSGRSPLGKGGVEGSPRARSARQPQLPPSPSALVALQPRDSVSRSISSPKQQAWPAAARAAPAAGQAAPATPPFLAPVGADRKPSARGLSSSVSPSPDTPSPAGAGRTSAPGSPDGAPLEARRYGRSSSGTSEQHQPDANGGAGAPLGARPGAPGRAGARASHAGNRSPSPGDRRRSGAASSSDDPAAAKHAMQQQLHVKFGEEAAAFMLLDLAQVPEHLHLHFYNTVLQLRTLPSPLPATMGEAYHAVFSQHYAQSVEALEKRVATFRTQMAAAQAAAATQLAALQQKLVELTPNGTRQTPAQQAAAMQLQAQQRALHQAQAARQAEADALAAQLAEARARHAKVMQLLCVLVAARERLSRAQLGAMGLEAYLAHLPSASVLFSLADGLFRAADPSLESWLGDARAAQQFHADPRAGHAALGRHYLAIADRDAAGLDGYGMRHVVPHLLLSEAEAAAGERLLMDPDYLEQVFRARQDTALMLGLSRLTAKSELVGEVLRWLRTNTPALRAHPRAVLPLWQAAPGRSLLTRLAASASVQAAAAVYASRAAAPAAPPASLNSTRRGSTLGVAASAAPPRHAGPLPPAAAAAAGGRRGIKPQCALLNPPPFWPVGMGVLYGHAGGVTSLSYCKHNRVLVAATLGTGLRVWDPATRDAVVTLTEYGSAVPCAVLHPTGRLLAVGSAADAHIRVRPLDTGEGSHVAYEPSAGGDATTVTLHGVHGTTVTQMSYSPDGHLLAAVYDNGAAVLWDPDRGVRSSVMPPLSRGTAVRSACFAPDGQLLALGCANGTIRTWHLAELDPLKVAVLRAYDNGTAVRGLQYNPSGLVLASVAEGASDVALWDVATGQQVQLLAAPRPDAPTRSLTFSPSGLLLAVAGDDGDISIWNTNTRGEWAHTAILRGHRLAVNALAFSPCGLTLASAGNEDGVRLWDVGAAVQRSELLRLDAGEAGRPPAAAAVMEDDEATSAGRMLAPGLVTCIAHNPAGTLLAAGMQDGAVCVWSAAAPQRLARLADGGHAEAVGRVVFASDGGLLASASADGLVCIWDASSRDPEGVRLLSTIQVDSGLGHEQEDAPAAAPPPAAHADGSHHVRIASPPAAAPHAPPHRRPAARGWVTLACSIAFSPGGGLLASAHDDGTALLWHVPRGTLGARLRAHARLAFGLQHSANGRLLATWSDDGQVCVWDQQAALAATKQGQRPEPVCSLRHEDYVYAADFSPDAALIASASRDGQLSVASTAHGARVASCAHGHPTSSKSSLDALRFSPTGLLLATGSPVDGVVRLWHARSCALLRELHGVRLLAWPGSGTAPWAAACRADFAPFVVRLPERALLQEAAAVALGEEGSEVAAVAEAEFAEGLASAAVGRPPLAQTGPAAEQRAEHVAWCRELAFEQREDAPLAPIVAEGSLRPAVRLFCSTPHAGPLVSLRGRSIVLADQTSVSFYSANT